MTQTACYDKTEQMNADGQETRAEQKDTAIQSMLEDMGRRAKQAGSWCATLSAGEKNDLLLAAATQLEADAPRILAANAMDVQRAKDKGMAPGLVDRLTLTPERIAGIAAGIREVAALPDPIGRVYSIQNRPNVLQCGRKLVPLVLVFFIY